MKKRFFAFRIAVVLLVTALTAPAMAADSGSAGASDAMGGVVRVYMEGQDGSASIGSAFGIGTVGQATDTFLTNRHVVATQNDDGSWTVARRVYLVLDSNSLNVTLYAPLVDGELNGELAWADYDSNTDRMVECDVLYWDEDYDFAVIRAIQPVEGRVALELAAATEDVVRTLDRIYALGYPSVSDEIADASGWEFTGNYIEGFPIYAFKQTRSSLVKDVTGTEGSVSRFSTLTDEGSVKVIQHTAKIHSGNSGGPLVSGDGVVVGINTYGVDGTDSLNYAVYIDYALKVLDEMEIPYNAVAEKSINFTVIGAAALVVLAVGVVLWLLLRGKGGAPQAVPASAAMPVMPGDGGLRLQGIAGTFLDQRYSFAIPQIRMGRDPARNDLVFPADTQGVSGVHCVLVWQDGQLYLQDLGSSCGTFVNDGQRLSANQTVALRVGDRFYLGSKKEGFLVCQKWGQ